MKRFIYLGMVLMVWCNTHAQQKLRDGVYMVDKLSPRSHEPGRDNKLLIRFNPYFLEEAPEEYSPISIFTNGCSHYQFIGIIFYDMIYC